MKLNRIIEEAEVTGMKGDTDLEITGITFDSRNVNRGDLFVAVKGSSMDGHRFIPEAVASGAAAIVCEEMSVAGEPGIPVIGVAHSRKALARMASAYYGYPSRELQLVGVTGTNGKTTIATLLHRMHVRLGFKSGLISTIRKIIGDEVHPVTHTTPDALQINASLREMVEEGCEYCFMEVSSHAVDQDRVYGLEFTGGVFTNLTRDHLDYHQDFSSYLNAKKRFFDRLPGDAFALVNGDDRNGRVMLQNCRAETYSYSLNAVSDFSGRIHEMIWEGTSMDINGSEVWIKLPGRFNASNLLAVYGVAVLLGLQKEEALEGISELEAVEGRFELVRAASGTIGIVDYAHTPDALQNVLDTIREVNVTGGRIITVIGAGGDRDRGKRPVMARIAAAASHRVILTSDNPRNEDPETIIDDMFKGIPPRQKELALRIPNREEAIRTAAAVAGEHDIVLVAGKGHERTQEIRGEKREFDDKEILINSLKG